MNEYIILPRPIESELSKVVEMISVFYSLAALWIGWLLLNGLRTGEVWARGGSKDRLTRSLDMKSFAHKVSRDVNPYVYWFHIMFYLSAVIFLLWMLLGK